jgi:phosphopantetheine adenylyltransferase
LDTRAKIRTREELRPLLAQGNWTILAGEFDPVTAGVAELFAKSRRAERKLLVVLRSSPEESLSAEARAVLVAGLRAVDAVFVAGDEEWRRFAAERSVPVIEEDGARGRQDFEALVCARQRP